MMLLIGGFVLFCSCLLLLAFLCHKKRLVLSFPLLCPGGLSIISPNCGSFIQLLTRSQGVQPLMQWV